MSQATVYRYSYGKIVEQEQGAVVPGVDHAPTSIAPELDDRVLAFCHPAALIRQDPPKWKPITPFLWALIITPATLPTNHDILRVTD